MGTIHAMQSDSEIGSVDLIVICAAAIASAIGRPAASLDGVVHRGESLSGRRTLSPRWRKPVKAWSEVIVHEVQVE